MWPHAIIVRIGRIYQREDILGRRFSKTMVVGLMPSNLEFLFVARIMTLGYCIFKKSTEIFFHALLTSLPTEHRKNYKPV